MVRTKCFVGNLSFSTAESQLAKEFEVAGKVISANIITRGPRSLGYGFVEFDSEEDAQNAVRLLNKKEIDGRQVNVEVAKAREEGQERGSSSPRGSRGGPRGGGGGGGGRGRGGFRGRGGSTRGGGRFRRRSASEDEGEEKQGGTRRPRGPRPSRFEEKKEDNRTPSKTTLFVANLPFSLDDDGFAKVFKDHSLAFKSAHVVKKKTGRSKGFGFVEFDNEKDQQKALSEINNKPVDGRELVVKVALMDENGAKGESATGSTATSTSATTTTTTTTTTTAAAPKEASGKAEEKEEKKTEKK